MEKEPHYSDPQADAIAFALKELQEEILALIEAMASGAENCDVLLADMLEGEPEHVRVAIVEKIREMLRERASEKEKELDKILDAQKRQVVERQRNVFMQWLQWIMSEETLRKIRMAFLASPRMEVQVKNIGEQLAARGVLQQMQHTTSRQDLGELGQSVPGQGAGRDKGQGRQ